MKSGVGILVGSLFQTLDIHFFNLFPCPGSFAQKRQTGFYTRVVVEAANIDLPPHFFPTVLLNQMEQHLFEGNPVEWIIGLRIFHVVD